jgi:hypothetical protein
VKGDRYMTSATNRAKTTNALAKSIGEITETNASEKVATIELIAKIEPSFASFREGLPPYRRDLFDEMFGKYVMKLSEMTTGVSPAESARRVIAMCDGGCMSIVRQGDKIRLHCDMEQFRKLRRMAKFIV